MGGTKARTSLGKPSTAETRSFPEKTFIIDNGAYSMKAGYAPDSPPEEDEDSALSACSTIPNTIAKTRGNRLYIGPQLNTQITDLNEMMFRRPVEKGYIVNWEAQKEIWEHSFFDEKTVRSKELRIANPEETTLVLTEAPNALPVLQKNADEMVMEEWGFGGYVRCVGKICKWRFCVLYSFDLFWRLRSAAERLERSTLLIRGPDCAESRFRYFSHRMPARCRFRILSYYSDSSVQRTAAATGHPPA